MTALRPTADEELRELVAALREGTLSAGQAARLNDSLANSPSAREVVARYTLLQAMLETAMTPARQDRTKDGQPADSPPVSPAAGCTLSGLPVIITDSSVSSPAFSLRSPVVGWLFSYAASALLVGAGLLTTWAWKVSDHNTPQVVQFSPPADSAAVIREPPEPQSVGRISGMAGCRWADPQTVPRDETIPLGRKYELVSGLMEISYQSGAKVILQGPCTYEVDSTTGGFLSLGKLTARVEKRGEGRGAGGEGEANPKSQIPNQEISNPQSLIPNPLFVVRTPTAIVTDLGTEFGVEVTREGHTNAEVFRVHVQVATVGGGDSGNHQQVCREGESVRVGAGELVIRAIAREKDTAAPAFVRAMPPPQSVRDAEAYAGLVLSLNPAAYYRMERPGAERRRQVVFDSAPGGHHGELRLGDEPGPAYVPGRFGEGLWLRGPGVRDRVFVHDYPKTANGRLTVAAWVMAASRPEWAMIASNWGIPDQQHENTGQFQLCLYRDDGDLCVCVTQRDGQRVEVREGRDSPFPLRLWQHVALVADGATLHLYRNGKEVASCPPRRHPRSAAGGQPEHRLPHQSRETDAYMSDQPEMNGRYFAWYWQGGIDELAIFNQALSPQTIERLYLGEPNVTGTLRVPSEAGTRGAPATNKGDNPMNGP